MTLKRMPLCLPSTITIKIKSIRESVIHVLSEMKRHTHKSVSSGKSTFFFCLPSFFPIANSQNNKEVEREFQKKPRLAITCHWHQMFTYLIPWVNKLKIYKVGLNTRSLICILSSSLSFQLSPSRTICSKTWFI